MPHSRPSTTAAAPDAPARADAALAELVDDPDLTGGATLIEAVGDTAHRLVQVQVAMRLR
ncbi:hypothetical protein GCM10022240_03170 [Microbacterium kribbense]|uniref:Uncharacterized protein n=1 Tax=Microbacterium kribbense TaxID=433645 RepID=A0ABP7G148_9MICO